MVKTKSPLNKGGCDSGRVQAGSCFQLLRLSLDFKRMERVKASVRWE